MDPDIVADPHDHAAMSECIRYNPYACWVARHKLWPASTGRDDWAWGFGPVDGDMPLFGQDPHTPLGWFALGMTYVPAQVLDYVVNDLACWMFGEIDMGLSRAARQLAVPIYPVAGCRPKHVHFTRRAGDVGYRP